MYQASEVMMNENALIDASAVLDGDGSTVVLWSGILNTNSVTSVLGEIYAEGGKVEAMVGRWKHQDFLDIRLYQSFALRPSEGQEIGSWIQVI